MNGQRGGYVEPPHTRDDGLRGSEVLDERVDEIGNRVALGHDGRLDAELLRGFGGDRADRRDDRRAQQIGGLLLAEDLREVLDRAGARERDGVDLPVEQHPVDVLVAVPLARRRASSGRPRPR